MSHARAGPDQMRSHPLYIATYGRVCGRARVSDIDDTAEGKQMASCHWELSDRHVCISVFLGYLRQSLSALKDLIQRIVRAIRMHRADRQSKLASVRACRPPWSSQTPVEL